VEFKGSCCNQNLVSHTTAKNPCEDAFCPHNLSVYIVSIDIISPYPNMAGCFKQTENISQQCTFRQPKFRAYSLFFA